MRKKKTRFFASPFIMIGLIIMLLLIFGIWALFFTVYLQGGNNVNSKEEVQSLLIVVSIVVAISLVTFAGTCHKGFSVFEISKKGVKKSLFKIFKKTEISWEEMHEIRCYDMISVWIFFSKTSLEGLPYNDIIKHKDVLQIEYSKQLIELIRSFTDKEIINLPAKTEEKNDC